MQSIEILGEDDRGEAPECVVLLNSYQYRHHCSLSQNTALSPQLGSISQLQDVAGADPEDQE